MNEKLLTPKEVAARLQISTATLEGWRAKRTGPEWQKLGDGKRSPIRYPEAALDAWLKSRTG